MEGGLGLQCDGGAFRLFKHRADAIGNIPGVGSAYIEDIHGRFPQDFLVVGVKTLGGDGFYIVCLAQTGHAEGIPRAHYLHQTVGGVSPLIVLFRGNGGQEILLFALYKVSAECAVFRKGAEQKLLQKGNHRGKDPIAVQSVFFPHKAAAKAGGLIIAHPAQTGAQRRAVQIVQSHSNRTQVGGGLTAPEQYRRQKRVQSGFLPAHRPHKLHGKALLLKSGIGKTLQGDARQQSGGVNHKNSLGEK